MYYPSKINSTPMQRHVYNQAYEYFNKKFGQELKDTVSAFKFAGYFDPTKVVELQPVGNNVDNLKIFPFLKSQHNIIDNLKNELPKYLAMVEDVSSSIDKNDWWMKHETELPHWSKACKMVLLVQPSSAAAERVFSLLSNSFTER